ncbi:MAG: pentapeptide repeat-containing protein [Saccharospirillaceae bacterium]|nr:pentapeptide repeat-containing protein [Pseudomonadales bacterium]NRB80769.1 pentapeptide repeat-containing protein [Saccharospirillaceae bacterium]
MGEKTKLLQSCLYKLSNGELCARACDNKGFCSWHSPEGQSKDVSISQLLSENLKSGACGEGYILKHCNLQNIDLVNRGCHDGYNLIGADFYHANLKSAHLFKANLKNASLMKADLSYANLHEVNLEGCNLLGAKFDGAKIENVRWGNELLQETQAREQPERALEYYQQVVEICRGIRKAAENQGLFETAGYFFHKEMVYRRFQIPKFSFQRFISKTVDIFCGYGEKPIRVVLFSIFFILVCALGFAYGGVAYNAENIKLSMDHSIWGNAKVLLGSIYFSVVTFTTLGYGDLTPVGMVRVLAAFEAFIGSFTSALFVVVFVKKMTR